MNADRAPALQGSRILVVEDEMLIAMEMESLLEAEGCEVVGPASSCDKALRLIESNGIDACILDLNLNGKPVTPVARELQSRDVPFIIVSGYAQTDLFEPEMRGARQLTKPVNERKMLALLEELVSAKSASEDRAASLASAPDMEE